jgi:hypothetical protein
MTSSLLYTPVVDRPNNYFSDGFKLALRHYYGEPLDVIVDDADIPFLKGVLVAGIGDIVRDANKLVELIEAHGEVRIHEEY